MILVACVLWGCTAQHALEEQDEQKDVISAELTNRVGAEPRPQPDGTDLTVPPGVTLEDGLTEGEAVAVALWNNAQFQADLATLGLASADLAEAGLLPNPVLSLVFPGTGALREGTLSFPIQLLHRPARVSMATLNLESTASSLIQNGLGLARDVRVAYADYTLARDRRELLAQTAQLLGRIAEIADLQLRTGQISALEASRAQIDWLAALADEQNSARDASGALHRLIGLLGIAESIDTISLQSEPSEELDNLPAIEELTEIALASRPDVRAAELAIEAAGENARWQRRQIYDFVALLDLDQQRGGDLDTGPGVEFGLPLFDRNQGGRMRATAEIQGAALRYAAVRQQVLLELRESYAAHGAAKVAVEAWRLEVVPTTRAAVEQTELAFEIGSVPELSVLLARQRLAAVQLSEADAVAELARASARLAYSVGQKVAD